MPIQNGDTINMEDFYGNNVMGKVEFCDKTNLRVKTDNGCIIKVEWKKIKSYTLLQHN